MSLPEQIQQQVDAANAILEQHYPKADGSKPAAEDTADSTKEGTAAPAEGQAASPAPVASAQQQPQGDENSETYAQRWRSLQGSWNAQARQLNDTKARLTQLESLFASMQPATTPQQTVQQTHLTEKDTSEFGAEMIDFAKRAAREEVAPVVSAIMALRDEIAALKGVVPTVNAVAANQRVTAQERFFADIARDVPDWATTNANADFHTWLLSPDPMTGITRQTYLEDAQRNFNAAQAASIFKEWARISGASPAPQQQAAPNKARSELEKQVAPGRAHSAPPPQGEQKRQWDVTDITKFYRDVASGAFRGRDAERIAMERDLFDAQRDGRITRKAA